MYICFDGWVSSGIKDLPGFDFVDGGESGLEGFFEKHLNIYYTIIQEIELNFNDAIIFLSLKVSFFGFSSSLQCCTCVVE